MLAQHPQQSTVSSRARFFGGSDLFQQHIVWFSLGDCRPVEVLTKAWPAPCRSHSMTMNSAKVSVITWIIVIALFAAVPRTSFSQNHRQAKAKPRIIVLTDMTSIKVGVREPDDAQSMIRLMLYSNEFNIEGLIASSGLGNMHGQVVRPKYIRKIVDAYAKDRPNLLLHDKHYPKADKLRQVIKRGQPVAGKKMPALKSIGMGKDTEASQWIIQKVDEATANRPIWITVWGGSADLAQVLWKVKKTRSPEALAKFVDKIRIRSSGDQDSTGPWIKSHFPDLYFITGGEEQRGFYRQGNTSLVSSQWVQQYIKGHGALGDLYPDYNGGDIWVKELGKVKGIKSGDSPTFMGLIPNGLNRPDHPTWVNWGGRREQDAENPHHYHDAVDSVANYSTDISPYLAAVYRWRPAFQADFQARLDWCVKPYSQANHAPLGGQGNIVNKRIKSGKKISLQAKNWRDPDGNKLMFHWQVLKDESSCPKVINITRSSSKSAYFTAPSVDYPQTVHVLLTVSDDGKPGLSSYQRFNFIVYPQ